MEHKLKNIDQLTHEKWVNLYKLNYENQNYLVASRNNKGSLVALTQTTKPDAVRVLPYYTQNNKIFVVFIKEFRYAINKYVYELPAGLIDGNEEPLVAAKRELLEEIGATTTSIKQISNLVYTSVGLSDESIVMFNAKIKLNKAQKLEPTEDINLEIVELKNIPKFLKTHEFCLCSYLMALNFYNEKTKKQL